MEITYLIGCIKHLYTARYIDGIFWRSYSTIEFAAHNDEEKSVHISIYRQAHFIHLYFS